MKTHIEGDLAQQTQTLVIENTQHAWTGQNITAEEIRKLAGLALDETIIQVSEDGSETVIDEEEIIVLKPGHRFRRRHHGHHGDHRLPVTVKVNKNPVVFQVHRASGAVIKSTAITQGVDIKQDFNLFEKTHHGLRQIGDDTEVDLHECEAFRATAPDDNS